MLEKLADHGFRLAALAQPSFPHGPGFLLAGVDLRPQLVQLLFPPRHLRLLLRTPFGERVTIGVKLLTLLDQTLLRLIDFQPLLDQGIPRETVVLGENLAGFLHAGLRHIGTDTLCKPAVGFFHGDAGFQGLAVRLFEFRAQLVEPVPAGLEVFRMQSHQILLPPEVGPRGVPLPLERFAVLLQLLPVGGEPRFERPPRLHQMVLLAFDRGRLFREKVVTIVQVPPEGTDLKLLVLQPDARLLLLGAEFNLRPFELLAGPVEMLLLEPQSVLQQNSFLTILGLELIPFESKGFPRGNQFMGGGLTICLGRLAKRNQFRQQTFPIARDLRLQLFPFGRQFETEDLFRAPPILLLGGEAMSFPLQLLARDALLLFGRCQFRGLGEEFGLALIQLRQASISFGLEFGTKQSRPAVLLVEQGELLVQPFLPALEFRRLKAELLGQLGRLLEQLARRRIPFDLVTIGRTPRRLPIVKVGCWMRLVKNPPAPIRVFAGNTSGDVINRFRTGLGRMGIDKRRVSPFRRSGRLRLSGDISSRRHSEGILSPGMNTAGRKPAG